MKTMTKKEVQTLINELDAAYEKLNNSSIGTMPFADYMYLKHDGKEDSDAGSDLLQLRQAIYSLSNACSMCLENLCTILPD